MPPPSSHSPSPFDSAKSHRRRPRLCLPRHCTSPPHTQTHTHTHPVSHTHAHPLCCCHGTRVLVSFFCSYFFFFFCVFLSRGRLKKLKEYKTLAFPPPSSFPSPPPPPPPPPPLLQKHCTKIARGTHAPPPSLPPPSPSPNPHVCPARTDVSFALWRNLLGAEKEVVMGGDFVPSSPTSFPPPPVPPIPLAIGNRSHLGDVIASKTFKKFPPLRQRQQQTPSSSSGSSCVSCASAQHT